MLKLGLQKFKEMDYKREKILITCKDFNIPSKKSYREKQRYL